MLVHFISWIAAGLIVGFAASKLVNLRGDDPNLGIGLSAVAAFAGGLLYCLITGSPVGAFTVWSVLAALAVAAAAVVVWHFIRTRGAHATPTARRSY